MRHELASVIFAWLVSMACSPPRFPPDLPPRIPPVAAADTPSQEPPPSCVHFWPEARYRNYGYDHIVHLDSRCQRTASCRVSTDVTPAPVVVAIDPGEHIEVLTYRGSPSPEFTADVDCARGTR